MAAVVPGAVLLRVLLDQVPVSLDDRVHVELWKVAPEPVSGIQDPRGELRWSLAVAPGAEAGVDLAYTVRQVLDQRMPPLSAPDPADTTRS